MSEVFAKDVLGELDHRKPCGSFLIEKVGRRGWKRPNVCISARIYLQYRIADPWDPTSRKSDEDIGLGPVALRLGENRRQPAPHLMPKSPKKKATNPAEAFRPRVPSRSATSSASSKPKKASGSKVDPELERLRAEAAKKRQAAEQARAWPRRRVAPPAEPASKFAVPPLPVRPEARASASADGVDGVGPVPKPATPKKRKRAGRFQMSPTKVQNAPVVRRLDAPEPSQDAPAVEKKKEKPVKRGVTGGGLDDLFGAAAQAGRLRMPKVPQSEDE